MEEHVTTSPNVNDNEMYAKGKLSIIVTTNAERERINLEMLNSLLPNKKSFAVSSVDQATNVKNPPPLDQRLPMTKTGQLESQVVFKEGAPVMVTSNFQEKKYKLNGVSHIIPFKF